MQRHDGKTTKNEAELQFGGRDDAADGGRQVSTLEGRRLEHQEELSKRWRMTTRSKAVSGEDSRRQWW